MSCLHKLKMKKSMHLMYQLVKPFAAYALVVIFFAFVYKCEYSSNSRYFVTSESIQRALNNEDSLNIMAQLSNAHL